MEISPAGEGRDYHVRYAKSLVVRGMRTTLQKTRKDMDDGATYIIATLVEIAMVALIGYLLSKRISEIGWIEVTIAGAIVVANVIAILWAASFYFKSRKSVRVLERDLSAYDNMTDGEARNDVRIRFELDRLAGNPA